MMIGWSYDDSEMAGILLWHVRHGVVFSDGKCLLCAYATRRDYLGSVANEIESKKGLDNPDCWYVSFASGEINRAFDHFPPLEWIAYRRMDEMFRIIGYERMRRLLWARCLEPQK